jgi:DNA-binding transcriptional ArsR family regulator
VEVFLTDEKAWFRCRTMEEGRYRESRLCRLLGNPVIYQLILLLDAGGPVTPSKLARLLGRQISTVSVHLAKLRNADIVRYDTSGKETRYWLTSAHYLLPREERKPSILSDVFEMTLRVKRLSLRVFEVKRSLQGKKRERKPFLCVRRDREAETIPHGSHVRGRDWED